jgi:hypothetical protein
MENERSVVVLSALVGAAIGGLAGYLFLTERGRRLRHELEPRLQALGHDVAHLQGILARVRDLVLDSLGSRGHRRTERPEWVEGEQAAPF